MTIFGLELLLSVVNPTIPQRTFFITLFLVLFLVMLRPAAESHLIWVN